MENAQAAEAGGDMALQQIERKVGTDPRPTLPLIVFGFAFLLGVVGNYLLRVDHWGLNALIAALVLSAGFQLLVQCMKLPLRDASVWLLAAPVLTSIMVWRAAEPLLALAFVATILALLSTAFISHGKNRRGGGVGDLIAECIGTGLHAVFGIFRLGAQAQPTLVQWKPWNTRAGAIVRGAVIAVPPLLVFGALFASADAVFSRLLRDLFVVELDAIMSHLVLTLVFTWLAAGWLYWNVVNDGNQLVRSAEIPIRAGIVEVRVALGLIMLLFSAFLLVQSRYLFGGEALIQETTGLTYAEYARSGFFQLVAVAFLSLPVLLIGLWLVRDEAPARLKTVRMMVVVVEVLILVIMMSALYRMKLYQEAYGLTYLRLLTTAFMVWLAAVFILFSATILRGKRRHFTTGTLVSALFVVVLLALVNPDARIVQANIDRAKAGAPIDLAYLQELSADAVPAILAEMPELERSGRCALAGWLLSMWGPEAPRTQDWRSWNYSEERARRLVYNNQNRLRSQTCAAER